MNHKIAIVTTTFNNLVELKRTLASVKFQTEPPDEFVVVDSSSPHIAKEVAAQAEKAGARHVWLPPTGVYPAMNRGLDSLHGDPYVWFVNSSDLLAHRQSISFVRAFLSNQAVPPPEWVIGGLVRLVGSKVTVHDMPTKEHQFMRMLLRGASGFPHPSTLVRLSCVMALGGFDERYKIAGDYALGLRFVASQFQPKFIDLPLTLHLPDGISYSHPVRNSWEKVLARKQVFPGIRGFGFNLLASFYALRGLARRLSVLPSPNPPARFMRLFEARGYHFCDTQGAVWPKCCLAFLDEPKLS